MGEEGRWPGLRDQKDLLDQSCVCVIQFQREAGFVSFMPFQPRTLTSRVTPFLASKPAQP